MSKNWQRRLLLKSLLRELPYRIIRFPGVKFTPQNDSYQKYLKFGFRPTFKPESEKYRIEGITGCWIAHSQVLEQVSEQNGITVVLEDDFVCGSRFFENALSMVNGFDRDFDIILFDTRGEGPLAMHKIAENIYKPRPYSFPYYVGTHCLFVNNTRIPKILDAKLNAPVEYIDGFLLTSKKVDTYVFYTGECGTRGMGSDVNPGYKKRNNIMDILMSFLPRSWRERTLRFKRNFFKIEEKQYILFSEEKLRAFEGYYQDQECKDKCIKFAVKQGQLVLTQPGYGKQAYLRPISEIDFFSEELPVPMKFIKKENGIVTQFVTFDRFVFQKIDDYTPIVRKATALTQAQLKICEGRYQYQQANNLEIQIIAMEDHLVFKQLWDGKELRIVPESALDFFADDHTSLAIRFIKDKNGVIDQVIIREKVILDKI